MSRPHVLLITTDHWPASLLGCAGHQVIQTPTLDSLARSGIRYTNAYSECPVCIPARRTLMTGLNPRSHGDRTFQTTLPMPDVPTLAGTFREAGYQTSAVGKLHVFPQRARIGFDDVILAEEGRPHWGVLDDYDAFLGERGYPGRQFDHGMSNNQYVARPWHLPEELHVTNWTTQQMARTIRRRDPTRPGFWCLSYTHPHPPLVPPQVYWDLYRDVEPNWPQYGDWVPEQWRVANGGRESPENGAAQASGDSRPPLAYRLRQQHDSWHVRTPEAVRTALRAFYALCTHIDHQLRIVIGSLREEGVLDNTIILFTADHGDMLGNHGLWAKRLYYEGSANVPMILVPQMGYELRDMEGEPHPPESAPWMGSTDDRLVGLQDVMPTLLGLAGIEPTASCDGRSMLSRDRRTTLYGECNEGRMATRMIHDGRYKLVYYPAGNLRQLFDLANDPHELVNLAESADHVETLERLTATLVDELYGSDCELLDEQRRLIGLPDEEVAPQSGRGLALQRGTHWPPPPVTPPKPGETNPGTN
jgi:arylsulfatase A-like enzyme